MKDGQSGFARFLNRYPVISISIILLLLVFLVDIAFGTIYHLVQGRSFYDQQKLIAKKRYRSIQNQYRSRHPDFHHSFRMSKIVKNAVWGGLTYRLVTNGYGFKAKTTLPVSPSSQNWRILFIGDSFTGGLGFSHENTFVGLIESELERSGIEVFNAGVSSYSPMIYWRKLHYFLENDLLEVDEVVVYIDISDIDDDDMRLLDETTGRIYRWRLQNKGRPKNIFGTSVFYDFTHSYTIATHWVYSKVADVLQNRDSLLKRAQVGRSKERWTMDEFSYEAYGKSGLQKARNNMDKLLALLNQHEVGLTIAVYPWPDQIYEKDLNSIQVSYWAEWARENDIELLNYFPCFISDSDTRKDAVDTIRRYFFKGDIHWNKSGHEVIADGYLAFHNQSSESCVSIVGLRSIPGT